MEIVRRLPAELRGKIFFFLRHPVAEIYRPIWLQPSWYRDAIVLIGYTERLEHLYISIIASPKWRRYSNLLPRD